MNILTFFASIFITACCHYCSSVA